MQAHVRRGKRSKVRQSEVDRENRDRAQDEWRELMEREYEKEKVGHRNRHYEAWLQFAASAFIDEWGAGWDTERCRRGLIETGHIEEGTEERGRSKAKRNVTSSRTVVGEVMTAGGQEKDIVSGRRRMGMRWT